MFTSKVLHGLMNVPKAQRDLSSVKINKLATDIKYVSNCSGSLAESHKLGNLTEIKQNNKIQEAASSPPTEVEKSHIVKRDVEYGEDGSPLAMNISVSDELKNDIAGGRCSILEEEGENKALYISAMYVDGNSNSPTKKIPNEYNGIGTKMMFEAVKFGLENNALKTYLVPLDGSEGFYLKMGFHPKSEKNPKRIKEYVNSDK